MDDSLCHSQFHIKEAIILDDMTYNGVFQALLKADDSHVPLITLDEGHDLFKKVVSGVLIVCHAIF